MYELCIDFVSVRKLSRYFVVSRMDFSYGKNSDFSGYFLPITQTDVEMLN